MPAIATVSIYVDDIDAAVDFYTKHLGFSVAAKPAPVIVVLDHDGVSLVLCKADKRTKQNYPAGTGTVLGLSSPDVAAAASKLAKSKVELVVGEPQPFPGGQFIAVRDPAGNVIELLQFEK